MALLPSSISRDTLKDRRKIVVRQAEAHVSHSLRQGDQFYRHENTSFAIKAERVSSNEVNIFRMTSVYQKLQFHGLSQYHFCLYQPPRKLFKKIKILFMKRASSMWESLLLLTRALLYIDTKTKLCSTVLSGTFPLNLA
jgi:hypothetical protein